MKQFVRYMLHNFQVFTGVYLVITAIRHIISHTIPTELAIFLIIIGVINVIIGNKES